MAGKETVGSQAAKAGPLPFVNLGQEQTEAAMALQKALLESCDQASRAWLARVQSEVSLWSDLANKLSGTKSIPEAFEAYSKTVSQRMQMAAEDGRKLVDEYQQLTQKITKSLGNGWPRATT
jgi:Phasin protein